LGFRVDLPSRICCRNLWGGAFLKGLKVNGFLGALIATGSIAILASWLISLTDYV
jgi:hypothetical protein